MIYLALIAGVLIGAPCGAFVLALVVSARRD